MPSSFDDLDVNLPNATVTSAAIASSRTEVISVGNFLYYVDKVNNIVVAPRKKSPTDTNIAADFGIGYWFDQDPRTTSSALAAGSMACTVRQGTANVAFYTSICKSLGAKDANSVVLLGVTHYRIN